MKRISSIIMSVLLVLTLFPLSAKAQVENLVGITSMQECTLAEDNEIEPTSPPDEDSSAGTESTEPILITSISVSTHASGASTILAPDTTLQLEANTLPTDATDNPVAWSSSDETAATVNESGLVTAVATGSATIRAEACDGSGVYGEIEITVEFSSAAEEEPPEGESEDSTQVSLSLEFSGYNTVDVDGTAYYILPCAAGDSVELGPVVQSNGTLTYRWQVYDADAETADRYIDIELDENATADKQALNLTVAEEMMDTEDLYRCVVTAVLEDEMRTAYAYFMLETEESQQLKTESGLESIAVTSVEITAPDGAESIPLGETLQLSATVMPEDAADKAVTWTSSDREIATVDETGLVTSVASGTVTITATVQDGSMVYAEYELSVIDVPLLLAASIPYAPPNTSPTFSQYTADWEYWLQGASKYSAMRSWGCRVVAFSKLIVESGFPLESPDDLFEWGVEKGYFLSSDTSETRDFGEALIDYIAEKGGVLTKVGRITLSGNNAKDAVTVFELIKQGYYVLPVRSSHTTYVGRSNSLSNNKAMILDSWYNWSSNPYSVEAYSSYSQGVYSGAYYFALAPATPEVTEFTANSISESTVNSTTIKATLAISDDTTVNSYGFSIGTSSSAGCLISHQVASSAALSGVVKYLSISIDQYCNLQTDETYDYIVWAKDVNGNTVAATEKNSFTVSACDHPAYNNDGTCKVCGELYNWGASRVACDLILYPSGDLSGIELKDRPYGKGTVVGDPYDFVHATGYVINHYGNLWYEITYNNSRGYVYSGNVCSSITVSSVTLTTRTAKIPVGYEFTLNACIAPSNATNKNVVWSSTDNNVATVLNGTVKAVGQGSATITAASVENSSILGTCSVTVTGISDIQVTHLYLDADRLSLYPNDIYFIEPLFYPVDPDNMTVEWATSDTTIVTISEGKITAISPGTAVISARSNDNPSLTATCTITVLPVEVTNISILSNNETVVVGEAIRLSATVYPDDASNSSIVWSVAPGDGDATIDQSGQLLATKSGSIAVYATAADGSGVKDGILLTVVNPDVTPEQEMRNAIDDGQTEIYVVNSFSLTGDLTIPEGVSLHIYELSDSISTEVVIPASYRLLNSGTIVIWGSPEGDATATLSVEGEIQNNGKICVYKNGHLDLLNEGAFYGNSITLGDGGGVAGDIPTEEPMSAEELSLRAALAAANSGESVMLSKSVSLTADLEIPEGVALFIYESSNSEEVVFQIADGCELINNGRITLWAGLTEADCVRMVISGTLTNNATIQVKKNGYLELDIDGEYYGNSVSITDNGFASDGIPVDTPVILVKEIVVMDSPTVIPSQVAVGKTMQIVTAVIPDTAADTSVTLSVINETGSATIAEDGTLTGVSPGTVVVCATANDGSGTVGYKSIDVIPDYSETEQAMRDAFARGNSFDLYTSMTLSADLVVPEGLHLRLWNSGDGTNTSLIIPSEYTLQNNGDIIVAGDKCGTVTVLRIEGSFKNNGGVHVREYGRVEMADTGSFLGNSIICDPYTGHIDSCLPDIKNDNSIEQEMRTAFANGDDFWLRTSLQLSSDLVIPSGVKLCFDDDSFGVRTELLIPSGYRLVNHGSIQVYSSGFTASINIEGTLQNDGEIEFLYDGGRIDLGSNAIYSGNPISCSKWTQWQLINEAIPVSGVYLDSEQEIYTFFKRTGAVSCTILGEISLSENLTIPQGCDVWLASNYNANTSLTIPLGECFVNYGRINIVGSTQLGYTSTMQIDGTIENHGAILVCENGFLYTHSDDAFYGNPVKIIGSGVISNWIPAIGKIINVTEITIESQNNFNELKCGASIQLSTEVLPQYASDKNVIWSVTNGTGAATITQDGVLIGEEVGTVTAIATAVDGSEIEGIFEVIILPVSIRGIIIPSQNALYGYETKLRADIVPINATNQNLAWSIESGNEFAAIDPETGVITGLATGTVTVRATANDGSGVFGEQSINIVDGYPLAIDTSSLSNVSEIWIDGAAYAVDSSSGMINIPLTYTGALSAVAYSYNNMDETDPHKVYPTGMAVWLLSYDELNEQYTATRAEDLDNVLRYAGSSIRITGNKGIRMITSVPSNLKEILTSSGLYGYTLVEYGTCVAWASEMSSGPLTLEQSYTMSAYAYKRGVSDPIYKITSGMTQYTNVLVGFSNDQCIPDLAMRPYMILENKAGQQVTLYGGVLYRSIGYIAYQNRNAFATGSDSYEYIWSIIHYVYGTVYDDEYKG